MSAWIGPAIIAAVISSIATAIGWFITIQRDKRKDAEQRTERVEDVQRALRAEIRSNHARLASIDFDHYAKTVAAKIRASSSRTPYTPFVPRDSHALIYTAIAKDISILPANVIDPVVLYYTQVTTIALFVDDLRSDRFQGLDKDRKIQMYKDYIDLNIYAQKLAKRAMDAINASLDQ